MKGLEPRAKWEKSKGWIIETYFPLNKFQMERIKNFIIKVQEGRLKDIPPLGDRKEYLLQSIRDAKNNKIIQKPLEYEGAWRIL